MIRITGTVVYRDGRRVAFTGGPRELVAWEAFALGRGLPTTADEPGRGAPYTMVYFLAWTLATREQAPRIGFEPWMDQVAEIDGFELIDADPTPPARSDGESSSSPPPPDTRQPTSISSIRASSQP